MLVRGGVHRSREMGVETQVEVDPRRATVSAMVTPPQVEVDVESDDEDVSVCPVFVAEGDGTLPRRNLDALFASTPTLPRKRRMHERNLGTGNAGSG